MQENISREICAWKAWSSRDFFIHSPRYMDRAFHFHYIVLAKRICYYEEAKQLKEESCQALLTEEQNTLDYVTSSGEKKWYSIFLKKNNAAIGGSISLTAGLPNNKEAAAVYGVVFEGQLCPTTQMLDRPHIIYNKAAGKYVCWMKIMNKNGTQTETVMTADHVLGPYEMVQKSLRPLGMNAGDFDLSVAPDGKAYYYFERVHSETICADTWHGPYTVQGCIHTEDVTHTSYHSQISCIFKVQGKKDLYIACADRWLPELQHLEYDVYSELFRNAFDPDRRSEDTVKKMQAYLGDDSHRNTSIADYVWLPLRFEGERVFIDWKDEWKLEDYE